ncbi:ubiquitin-protein ligase hypothetical protein [Limosa lapponica baueri]|uniref:HECT-type E3 ubiquitin transferase n=1 Tax=Limosa lapponica baueri TaxID=1758121 RepID=A0A2I0TUD6_LIMLA|nr:ubiquitin-protein ligase hypothetical protein [Limosa lapponica baueri]
MAYVRSKQGKRSINIWCYLEEKASLLHRTQEERRKREEERRRLKNAIIIQSFVRGYRDRKHQYSIQRSEFDRCANLAQSGGTFSTANGANLTLLVRQLLFFYRQNEDSKRLGDGRISVQYITEECLKKLDTKQQTNTLLNMVWRDSASEEVFTLMASICHTLMVQHRMMVPKVRLLYSLAFNARFLRHLWYLISSMTTRMITGSMVPLLQVISRGSPMSLEDSSRIIPLFYLFSSLFSHSLISIHDNEFFGDPIEVVGQRQSSMMPFTLEELVILSRCLRDACLGIIKLAYPETKPEVREEYIAAFRSVGVTKNTEMQQCIQTEQKKWIQLFKVITNLVKMLKSRDTRRNFCPPNHWLSEQENIKADKVTQLYVPSARHVWRVRRMGRIGPLQSTLDVGLEPAPLSVSEERQLAILTELPFVVPFEERVKIFQRLIYADKQEVQGDGPFLDGINVTIRRNYIYEDAYDKLSPENGGYTADHPVIKIFWRVVESFTDEEKRKLLKFVTSCSRPPLLGFKEGFYVRLMIKSLVVKVPFSLLDYVVKEDLFGPVAMPKHPRVCASSINIPETSLNCSVVVE